MEECTDMVLFEEIKKILISGLAIDSDTVAAGSKLTNDLGVDSIDALELSAKLEEKFSIEIREEEMREIVTVKDIVNLINVKINSK